MTTCAVLATCAVLGSIVVSISACHAEDPGSIPGRGGLIFFFLPVSLVIKIIFMVS